MDTRAGPTQVDEDTRGGCLELDVEVPAPTERTHGRLHAKRFARDDLDLDRAIRSLGVRARDLIRLQLLVGRLDHLALLREVNPKLQATRLRLARFLDRHLCVKYAATSTHPLHAASYDRALVPGTVFVSRRAADKSGMLSLGSE
jgi:hypothetical protein